MSDHARAQELAAIVIDFDLSDDERVELEKHLATCPSCPAYVDSLRADARAIGELPRFDAPERVHRRITAEPRPLWSPRLRLATAAIGVFVVAVGVWAGTGGLQFGSSAGAAPTAETGASQAPAASLPGPAASAAASSAPTQPPARWVAVKDQSAFDVAAATPPKDVSRPPPPCGEDCGDTNVFARFAVVSAAVQTPDGIVAVGYGCVGINTATCRANVWRSNDGLTWRAIPHDRHLDAGADGHLGDPTGMFDVAVGGPGLVAGGSVQSGRRTRAALWTSADGTTWRLLFLPHDGEAVVRAVAAWPDTVVAAGVIVADGRARAALWTSTDGLSWSAADVERADFGRIQAGDDALDDGVFDVLWSDDSFIAVGADYAAGRHRAAVWSAGSDARTWSRGSEGGLPGRMRSVAAVGSGFVAVSDALLHPGGELWRSPDGIEWSSIRISDGAPTIAVEAIDGGVIAIGDCCEAFRSTDGLVWERTDDGALEGGTIAGLARSDVGVLALGSGRSVDLQTPPAVWLLPLDG